MLAEEMGAAALLAPNGRRRPLVTDLPEWFRFPVNLTTGTVVQPAFDFLRADVMTRGEAARSTTLARAYDLKAYFTFLSRCETAWVDADQATIDEFTLDMVSAALVFDLDPLGIEDEDVGEPSIERDLEPEIEPDEGDAGTKRPNMPLSRSTVRRRLSTVQCFHGYAEGAPPRFNVRGAMKAGRRPQQTVRPITREDLARLIEALGPPPSRRTHGSSRLWLAVMLALVTGLRRVEVCGLDVTQFEMPLETDNPEREVCIRIFRTKGGAERDIIVPTWLLLEVRAYIDGERANALRGTADQSKALLLNHATARRAPLSRLAPETLSFDFRRLMLASGMKRRLTGFRFGRGDSELPHTFHDLRHTCACMTFVQASGRSADPWLTVQLTLGHRLLATTKSVYLKYLNEFNGDLIPFAILMTHYTTFNAATLMGLKVRDVESVKMGNAGFVALRAFKPRRGNEDEAFFSIDDSPTNPDRLLRFVIRWTSTIRQVTGSDLVWLAAGKHVFHVADEDVSGEQPGRLFELPEWLARNDLPRASFSSIRKGMRDLAHLTADADRGAIVAMGGQSEETIDAHYVSPEARRRERARVATAADSYERWIVSAGKVDARSRPDLADRSAATPGFSCLDNRASPITAMEGRACTAYGMCPVCPLALVDTNSPRDCAYLHLLLDRIEASFEASDLMTAAPVIAQWAPVARKLIDTWLPAFPNHVRAASKDLSLPRLPDVE